MGEKHQFRVALVRGEEGEEMYFVPEVAKAGDQICWLRESQSVATSQPFVVRERLEISGGTCSVVGRAIDLLDRPNVVTSGYLLYRRRSF